MLIYKHTAIIEKRRKPLIIELKSNKQHAWLLIYKQAPVTLHICKRHSRSQKDHKMHAH